MATVFMFIGLFILAFVAVVLIAKSFQKGAVPSKPQIVLSKNKTDTLGRAIVKSILIIVVLLGSFLFFSYGTVDPCGILNKEIAMQMQTEGGEAQGMYALFGGFLERVIDGMTPMQCAQKIFEVKTQGYEKALTDLEQSKVGNTKNRVHNVPASR